MSPMDAPHSVIALSRVAFANIFGIYWRGRYGENEVIIRQTDCFLNASKLCACYNKEFEEWEKFPHIKDLIRNIESIIRDEHFLFTPYIPKQEFRAIETVASMSSHNVDGKFIHPYLAPHLMTWLDPQFAVMVSTLVNEHLSNGHMEFFEDMKKIVSQRKLKRENSEEAVAGSYEQPSKKRSKVATLRERVRAWAANTHCVAILNLADAKAALPYYAIRCKRRAMNPTINKIRKRHPTASIIYVQKYVSNEQNLYEMLKKAENLKTKLNYFDYALTKEALIEKIRSFSEPLQSKEAYCDEKSYIVDSVIAPT